jgi:PAS domain S-box-containing protein
MEYDPRFRTTFDQAGIGFALIDSQTGNLIKTNKNFCDIVGLEKDSAVGSSFMAIAHPDDVQECLHAMKGLLEGGLGEFTMEKQYTRADGSLVFCNLTFAQLWDVDEEPTYHLVIVDDTTARRSAENHLQKINDLLGQRVSELMVELEAKTKELEATKKLLEEDVLKLRETIKNS